MNTLMKSYDGYMEISPEKECFELIDYQQSVYGEDAEYRVED